MNIGTLLRSTGMVGEGAYWPTIPGPNECTPKTCTELGAQCGQADDGCGGKVDCGKCDAPWTCSGNKCMAPFGSDSPGTPEVHQKGQFSATAITPDQKVQNPSGSARATPGLSMTQPQDQNTQNQQQNGGSSESDSGASAVTVALVVAGVGLAGLLIWKLLAGGKVSARANPAGNPSMNVVHLDAGHDVNGNPRRLYVLVSGEGGIAATVDEGYSGIGALDALLGKEKGRAAASSAPTIKIPAAQYRALKKDAPDAGWIAHYDVRIGGRAALRFDAGNDVNGNPRRVFVVFDKNDIVKVINEGYRGWPSELDDLSVHTLATTPSEYRSLLKLGKAR